MEEDNDNLDSNPNLQKDHAYDPSILYHSHAANVPHINSWIDELVSITERGNPMRKFPSTENLVDSLQRYDAVYRELLRQTSIFSEPVTKMLAKVWAGVLKLLDYMVKSYHRYVKHTSNMQEQAETLLAEKQTQVVASKLKEDEFDLEKTYLKAKIRNLESEIESMAATKRELDRENIKLRSILDRYVESNEMNNPVWDITNEDSENNLENSLVATKNVDKEGRHQLRELNRIEIEMNEVLHSAQKEEDKQKIIVKDIMGLLENNQEIFGIGSTIHNKWHPGVVVKKTFVDLGVQVDEKEQFGIVTDLIEENPEEMEIGVPMQVAVPEFKGVEIPFQLRKEMSTYPQVLRIPPAAWVCQTIMAIYIDKIMVDEDRVTKGLNKQTLAEHTYHFFQRQLQMAVLADASAAQFIHALAHHQKTLRRVALFSSQMGMYEKEEAPNMDVRDTDFILTIIQQLMDLGELVPDKASRRKLTKTSIVVKSDILRANALKTTEILFETWLPDGGQDYVLKVKSMQHTDKGHKYIDIDEFIEALIEPWHTVRLTWEDHINYLFREHCIVQRVLAESQFANDNGVRGKDTLLSQLSKASAKECQRRPMRLFQKLKGGPKEEIGGRSKGPSSGAQKEPVCEVINRKAFITTVLLVNPRLRVEDVEKMYDEAIDYAHKTVLRDLQRIWYRATYTLEKPDADKELEERRKGNNSVVPPIIEKYPYYLNMKTSLSQWAKPYIDSTFRAHDIEYDAFINIMIQKDILPNCPLKELLHMTPRDLWPNADMFHKLERDKLKKTAELN